jgi:hypothetical protein
VIRLAGNVKPSSTMAARGMVPPLRIMVGHSSILSGQQVAQVRHGRAAADQRGLAPGPELTHRGRGFRRGQVEHGGDPRQRHLQMPQQRHQPGPGKLIRGVVPVPAGTVHPGRHQ